MTMLRSAARTMLASYFVVSGIKAVRDPESQVSAAEPLVDSVVPQIQRLAPDQVADLVPTDARTWVRINGVLELAGGVALATGKGRRLGAALLALSLVPTTIGKYPFWKRHDPAERAADRDHFLKNLSLLGGVLIASRDTEGKPSLGYRAHKGSRALVKNTNSLAADTRKAGKKVAKETRQISDAALAEGALLVGTVVATTRKARKKANKQLKAAKVSANKQAAEAKKVAAKSAKQAQKTAGQAQKNAGAAAKSASKEASKQLASVKKEAGKQVGAAKKSASKFATNIHLGEN